MHNFSILKQLNNELDEFKTGRLKLATLQKDDVTVRTLKKKDAGYYFNQLETLSIIDLYYASKFENGERDKLGQRKIFLNIGKFRTEVASKQIDLDTKDFRFIPDDYADPWSAFFAQKEFREWSKDSSFAELVNECVEALPKYGSVVLKKVGKELKFVMLQNLRNEQSATSLKTASYVIEEHPDMRLWEMRAMKNWNLEGLDMKFTDKMTVLERYGHVPLNWLKKVREEEVQAGDENKSVDAMVIVAMVPKSKDKEAGVHIFFADEIKERPYREAHWSRVHGRWLGGGVMEDLIENQVAKNIVINLARRGLHWSNKRIGQSASTDAAAKNLVRDVPDGSILEVGQNGLITMLDLSAKNNAEVQQFLNETEKNSDQKAFTYEVSTGASMPSGTPATLGVILSKATNSYYAFKKEKLGIFLKAAIVDFQLPQFFKEIAKEDRVVMFFSDEPGFEALKAASMQVIKSDITKFSLLGKGEIISPIQLAAAIDPFEAVRALPFLLQKTSYKDIKVKLDLIITGEEIDLQNKLTTLNTLYTIFVQRGDSRAEKVLERISALAGENISVFGLPSAPVNSAPPATDTPTPQTKKPTREEKILEATAA